MLPSAVLLFALFLGIVWAQTTSLSGSHTDVPRWCGKAYMQGSPNFEPGGELNPPTPSPSLLLDVQVVSQHSIYDSSESTGTFLVDVALSHLRGHPYTNSTPGASGAGTSPFTTLYFDIREQTTDQLLATSSASVNSTKNLVSFDISTLKPRRKPYQVVLYGAPAQSYPNETYTATAELFYLPAKRHGSTVKIDRLHGGLLVANHETKYAFTPLLPFGFYGSCSGYFNTTLANITAYAAQGFNVVNPVCSFPDGGLTNMFDWLDQAGLWYQYDMRGTYLNLSVVQAQIPLVKDRSNLLMWYTADEPDGWQYALESTKQAYDLLRTADPYHPTALVMNCQNYYFKEYTSGADVIMEDVYPVGLNTTYSREWHTPVNRTFGDAGCDDCQGELTDVSDRLAEYSQFGHWLGGEAEYKPLYAVLQAFSGESYWSRDPTPQETFVMGVLAFNHGAKGVLSWLFPPSTALTAAHGQLAKAVTGPTVAPFLLGADPVAIAMPRNSLLDVAYWSLGDQILVGVANLEYEDSDAAMKIKLPVAVSGIVSQEFGSVDWSLKNGVLKSKGAQGLAVSFVVLQGAGLARSDLRAQTVS